jgi:proteasome lid subunit RPN8/RPN11
MMFRRGHSSGWTRDVPQSVVVYNYYYGFSHVASPVDHETHEVQAEPTPRFFMPRAVYEKLIADLSSVPPEACGMLLGPTSHGALITHFIPDASGVSSPTTFRIDGKRMTESLKPYIQAGLDVKGICHSHPSGYHHPSGGDLTYLKQLFSNQKNSSSATTTFYFPILSDGQVFHFAFDRTAGEDTLKSAKLALI